MAEPAPDPELIRLIDCSVSGSTTELTLDVKPNDEIGELTLSRLSFAGSLALVAGDTTIEPDSWSEQLPMHDAEGVKLTFASAVPADAITLVPFVVLVSPVSLPIADTSVADNGVQITKVEEKEGPVWVSVRAASPGVGWYALWLENPTLEIQGQRFPLLQHQPVDPASGEFEYVATLPDGSRARDGVVKADGIVVGTEAPVRVDLGGC